jgi:hypothetical protein
LEESFVKVMNEKNKEYKNKRNKNAKRKLYNKLKN